MATAGYSGTPLLKKLGIQPHMKLLLMDEPEDYDELLETDIRNQVVKKNTTPDLVHLFVKKKQVFESKMTILKSICKINPNVIIWVSWYKKTAGIPTDITEDVIRNYALKNDGAA
jgi:hypothetical protein